MYASAGPRAAAWARLRPFRGAPVLVWLLLTLLWLAPAAAAVAPGTVITNTAGVVYTVGGSAPLVAFSNTVVTITDRLTTPGRLELLRYAPRNSGAALISVGQTYFSDQGTQPSNYLPLPPPVALGSVAPLDLSSPLPLIPSESFDGNEPIFLLVRDLDQNLSSTDRDGVNVRLRVTATAEEEWLRLVETAPDSGVFSGYIQVRRAPAAAAHDGHLTAAANAEVSAVYADPSDPTDTAAARALIDPFGLVFDSATGGPVNGATITLLDADSGQAAQVFGDNGVDAFPSTLVSGAAVQDAGGRTYAFPPGGYRFPVVAPGRYRLQVVPPTAYAAPSQVPDNRLQTLPGAPFALVTPGSRGEAFPLPAGPPVRIDIPLDPATGGLWLRKSVDRQKATIGDFLQYRIDLQNTAPLVRTGLRLIDRLPPGFRYQPDSARLNGVSAAVALSGDGRTLTCALPDLAVDKTIDLRYVVTVAAGARPGRAVNHAVVHDAGGVQSNAASAAVEVGEELFGRHAIIAGRVRRDGCDSEKGTGVGGVRVYLEDGTYTVTDAQGKYHFAQVTPGTHVVQLDLETLPADLEAVACRPDSRSAGRPFSQFVDVQGGTLWRADFHAATRPQATAEVRLTLQSAADGAKIHYRVDLTGNEVPLTRRRLAVMLPPGLRYLAASSRLADAPLEDPQVDGGVLTYRLADVRPPWSTHLAFDVVAADDAPGGEARTRALLLFAAPGMPNGRTPEVENRVSLSTVTAPQRLPEILLRPQFAPLSAELNAADRQLLAPVIDTLRQMEILHITIIGHSDSNPIRPRSQRLFKDNYALAMARARSVQDYLAAALQLDATQTTLDARGPDQPVADNRSPDGRALNRRVELRVVAEKMARTTRVHTLKGRDAAAVGVENRRPAPPAAIENHPSPPDPLFDDAWLQTAAPGLAWLWPTAASPPPLPSTRIVVKHAPGARLRLLQNGRPVSALNEDGTRVNRAQTVAVTHWRGIDLVAGDNRFELQVLDTAGTLTARLEAQVHYAGPPVHAQVLEEHSQLTADGQTPPLVAVRLTDIDGFPVREGSSGDYIVAAPYAPWRTPGDLSETAPEGASRARGSYRVTRDGIAHLQLQPTSRAGEVRLQLPFARDTQELRVWLAPEARDWILVGLAEGTLGYATVSGHMQNLAAADVPDGYYDQGRLAFFAKGRIKGRWLLTLAADSARRRKETPFGRVIDPEADYLLYGDATQQAHDAPSREALYLKIEREQFYALFGDFDTDLTVTRLTRYSRRLTGLKSELQSGAFSFTGFASQNDQAFVRDDLRGDGTSGLYRLSRRNLVANSETVSIETRDRLRSEVVRETRKLNRHVDYRIDYDDGTLFFKAPVYSRDADLNPVFIVVTYEAAVATQEATTYGGRGAVHLLDRSLEIGATYVHEGQPAGDGDLGGIDAALEITPHTQIKAEVAASRNDTFETPQRGEAYLAEINHRSANLDGTAYVREQGRGFGLGQQSGSEDATRKMGVDAAYRLTPQFKIEGQAYRQANLETSAQRDMAELRGRFDGGSRQWRAGLREADDRLGDGRVRRSTQLLGGVGYRLLENRLGLRLDHEQTLSDREANPEFPTRTVVGADYRLTPAADLFGEQEFTRGAGGTTAATRLGLKARPWKGGRVGTSLQQRYSENADRLQANLGLGQTWQIDVPWRVEAGLDRSQTLRGDLPRFDPDTPPAVGSEEEFTALTLGTTYTLDAWSWTARVESRRAESEDKNAFVAGLYLEPQADLGLSAGLRVLKRDSAAATAGIDGDLRLGLAWRPKGSRWMVLDRLDYGFAEQTDPNGAHRTWRLVNNLNANFQPHPGTQIALQYGLKYVQERFDAATYAGVSDLFGIETRRALGARWDLGLRSSVRHTWNARQFDYSAGLSLGVSLVDNTWISLGYNFWGFEDADFADSGFHAQGPFIQFRLKFDQQSARRALQWFAATP